MESFFGLNPEMGESLSQLIVRNARAITVARGLKQPDLVELGLSAGTAHRVAGSHGPNDPGQNVQLQTLEKIAAALKVAPWMLLMDPYDPHDPPVVLPRKKMEEEINRRAKRGAAKIIHEWESIQDGKSEPEEDGGFDGEPPGVGRDEGASAGGDPAPKEPGDRRGTARKRPARPRG